MCALLLLIPIVNERENKSINAVEDYVTYLLSAVRVALKSQDLYSSLHKHHLRDLLRGLNGLTRFDANKRLLLEGHILGDITTMLQIAKVLPELKVNTLLQSPVPNTNSDNLATEVVRLLWQLCFLSETREQLSQHPSLISLCREFGDSSRSPTCRETVEGFLWSLSQPLTDFEGGNIKYTPLSATGNPYGYIVFACNRTNHRKTVDFLKRSLKRRGYNVYFEHERTEMEKALEDASALILCLSYSFSTSPFCRQQVLSALSYGVALVPVLLESNYEPETWLHYLLATVIYTSFTDRDDFERAAESLSLALTKYGIVRAITSTDDDPDPSEPVSPPSVASPWRSIALKNHTGQGVRLQLLSESSNASTPTPGECATASVCQNCQRSSFSTFSRLRSGSCSESQAFLVWSNGEESVASSRLQSQQQWEEEQEAVLAYQAPSPAIRLWDVERVQRWLGESGLAHYTQVLSWLDGNLLWELAWHRIRSCNAFFSNLEHHLNMPQHDQVLFFNTLALLADVS
ncbi:Toll Interleukin receptor [Echinococcus multilocularis]|uniref:Toll Interleukin receptor n=1 Tax=Echinococcus multilocularis TaxID=6211 RepID=A0A068YKJ0_ECHMU|nr:Toll Interleukin receptor [Echinococcus multilocularis]